MRLPILVSVVSAWLPAGLLFPADDTKLNAEARADIEIHFLAAKRAEAAGDLSGAVDEYETILKKYPKAVPEIYQNLGLVYYLARDYDAAIATAQQVVHSYPALGAACRTLIAALGQAGKPAEAQRVMSEALARFGERFWGPMRTKPPELTRNAYEHMLGGDRKAGVLD